MDYSNYIFFWGKSNNYGYFSNFYPVKFTDGEFEYNCSEQYFMKKKQELFDPNNTSLAKQIMNETSPSKIKRYGRLVRNFNDKKWAEHRYSVMLKANKLKFSQNTELMNMLLKTGDKVLVEASPRDRIWGIGLNESSAKKVHPTYWKGMNLLGKVLMEVRGILTKK